MKGDIYEVFTISNRTKSYSIFKKFFEDLKGDMTYSRLGKVFMTERNKYFYDMGTGKVLACICYSDSASSRGTITNVCCKVKIILQKAMSE